MSHSGGIESETDHFTRASPPLPPPPPPSPPTVKVVGFDRDKSVVVYLLKLGGTGATAAVAVVGATHVFTA